LDFYHLHQNHQPTKNKIKMSFKILYFSIASTYTKRTSESFPAPQTTVSLMSLLEDKYPGITDGVLKRSLMTVNFMYVDFVAEMDLVIGVGDEVAVVPPVGAG
jgi:molybdopterin converting factor small subunit